MKLAGIAVLMVCAVVTNQPARGAEKADGPAAGMHADGSGAVTQPGGAARADSVLASRVRATETAFAATMAARDVDAFASHISPEAIFFGGKGAMRGRDAVVAAWKRFFEGPDAPFSWAPEVVEVLDSGTLALSSGPVKDPSGKQIGTFNSIWQRGPDGSWKIVFDKGCPPCNCPEKP